MVAGSCNSPQQGSWWGHLVLGEQEHKTEQLFTWCQPGSRELSRDLVGVGRGMTFKGWSEQSTFPTNQNLSPEGSTEFKIIPQTGTISFESWAREDISDSNHNTRQAREASVNRNSPNFCMALKNWAVRRLPDLGLSGEYTISSHVTSPTRSLAATILNCDFSR